MSYIQYDDESVGDLGQFATFRISEDNTGFDIVLSEGIVHLDIDDVEKLRKWLEKKFEKEEKR